MKSKLFSGVKQFWQLNIYKRYFLSQEETEAVTDFRFSILTFGWSTFVLSEKVGMSARIYH